MGLFDWLRNLFGPKKVVRQISRLDPVSNAAIDAATEVVVVAAEPIKPHAQRLTFRDRRLLPKPKPKATAWPFTQKRKKIFTADEANRLFSATLRTRNRQIRDLDTDAAQLERYGLPLWKNEDDIALALGLSRRDLRTFSIHREAARVAHYVAFSIPKRSGGTRTILAPKKQLKAVLRKLDTLLASKLPVSSEVHGFVKGRSIGTGAAPHVGKRVVVRADLRDFFPSVTFPRVRGLLIAYGYSYPVAAILAVLMTEAERQPVEVDGVVYHVPVTPRHCVQGAPTSPAVCNAVARKLDRRLNGLAKRMGFDYTRYADDLTFSGDDRGKVASLLHMIKIIVESEGFRLNDAKTRIQGSGGAQRVTGVTVNEVAGVSRRERRKLRAAIHQATQKKLRSKEYDQLAGRVAFVAMLNSRQAAPLRTSLEAIAAPKREPAVLPGRTRSFVYVEGTSDKFWKITVRGEEHVVYFGRNGTAGQMKVKKFASEEAAQSDAAKLIREKLAKGYREV